WGIYSTSVVPGWSVLAPNELWDPVRATSNIQPVIRELVEGKDDRFHLEGDKLIVPRDPSKALLSEAQKLCLGFAQRPELLPSASALSGFRFDDVVQIAKARRIRDLPPKKRDWEITKIVELV